LQSGVVDLSAEQKQKLREFGKEFKNLLNSDKIVGYIREHNEHRNHFNEKLSSSIMGEQTYKLMTLMFSATKRYP
jgi:hypothetical protein